MAQLTQILNSNRSFEVTPTLTTDAYASGDAIGGLLTFSSSAIPNGGGAFIESVCIIDKGSNNTKIDVVFFDSNPSSTTITNNSALDVDDGDLDKIFGAATIYTSDYVSFNDNSVGFTSNLGIPIILSNTNRSLYVAMVERGTPTRAIGDLILKVNISWVGE